MFERYSESPKTCQEYLRLALPLMAKLNAAVNPANYALFFSYIAGKNQHLKHEISDLIERGERLTRQQCDLLYRKYFTDYVDDQVERFQRDSKSIIADVDSSLTHAKLGTAEFNTSLEKYGSQLGQPHITDEELQSIVGGMLADTRGMQKSYNDLQGRLQQNANEIQGLKQALELARKEATHDPLTGLANRRQFHIALGEAFAEMEAGGKPPCLLMLDIDNFKRVNDSYGHLFGDKVIKLVGVILQHVTKGQDTACRYGGEEFAVVLPDTPLEGGQRVAESIRSVVERGKIQRSSNKESVGNVTISVGVAEYRRQESEQEFIKRADAALYASKQGGRNRVTVANQPT